MGVAQRPTSNIFVPMPGENASIPWCYPEDPLRAPWEYEGVGLYVRPRCCSQWENRRENDFVDVVLYPANAGLADGEVLHVDGNAHADRWQ